MPLGETAGGPVPLTGEASGSDNRDQDQDLVWVITPFGVPQTQVVIGAVRAGALGILDLGRGAENAQAALQTITERIAGPFGVRVPARCRLGPGDLPEPVDTVVVESCAQVPEWLLGRGATHFPGRRVVAEVRSLSEAQSALDAGADGLVAKGAESGGRVGSTGAFVLAQQVLALTDRPVWVMGGIGRHTAAAAIAGGARGVVIDAQVALMRDARFPRSVRSAIQSMDGSETRVVAGHRVYNRPDLWVSKLDENTSSEGLASRLGAGDLTSEALPAGQDAAFAAGFERLYGSVGHTVQGLRGEIADHLRAAQQIEPLAPGRGVSLTSTTDYPVLQGPMTRVSDRAAFAREVAANGGLPFLALALLRAPEVRSLLEETAELLGDQPWGVGILGFVPKELREEQLGVIAEVRPPFAVIAGGRPAQAVSLEQAGTTTFLHVPAPALLRRFLDDGARRFIFEGSECGGHIGPRSSFALWEAQIEVLLDWGAETGRLDEVDVVFAGGIHDERSAAMVAALGGTLAERDARIGVLMGTAYLFTSEAVESGAIGEEFQDQALACEATATLESAPGHVTRCADTPFVETFETTRRQLVDGGADSQTRWAELESLNVGRLRVASKGIKREGDELLLVDRQEQRTEGMFMLGDVATLRSGLTSMRDLHESVTVGATEWLGGGRPGSKQPSVTVGYESGNGHRNGVAPEPADVAIVGMACIMPGARDLDVFWSNIVNGVNSITEVSPERWDPERYFDADWDHTTAHTRSGSASKWGGFLPEVPFDALAYGIPPSSLGAIEPTQLLSLKVAADALADAGYGERAFDRERTSVIFGAEGGTDQSAAHCFQALFPAYVGEMPSGLADWMPKMSEDTFPGLLTNVISGRIANRLDLGGKNLTVDAACASSLAAVDAACTELVLGRSDMVLAGGADTHNGIHDFLLFTSVHALSVSGQCRTFDSSADGITLGEGIACLALKRLEDAERDGDRIYSVIKSVAASSDGRSLGLTAPRPLGQRRALERAYAEAQMEPSEVGLVEAHGTGTVVGDRTELATLTEVFAEAGMPSRSCVIGSVKSNIGHTKCAAGLAGLIKAAKAIYHGVLPPTLHVNDPNEGWDSQTSPFSFLDAARPWDQERRVAGVSAFGFGGTNFHTVLTSHDDEAPPLGVDAWPAELFTFRGDPGTVDRAMSELEERLSDPDAIRDARLRDAAAAVSGTRRRGPVRVGIVADNFDDLRAKLGHARAGRVAPGVYLAGGDLTTRGLVDDEEATPKVAFLFPGQGSQRPGMAADLLNTFATTRNLLNYSEGWLAAMLPPASFGDEGQRFLEDAVRDTRVAQPALGLAGLAAAKVLAQFGVAPDMLGGHSYGELVALCLAGAIDEPTLFQLSMLRADAILAAAGDDPGGMLAVAAPRAQAEPHLEGTGVVVANENDPGQVVLSGPSAELEATTARLKEAGLTVKALPVACAFHSPVVAGAVTTLQQHLAGLTIRRPGLPVFSNLTASQYPDDPAQVPELIAGQVAGTVRFAEQVAAMYQAGARIFVEVGPGRVLTGCVERTLQDQPHVAIATDQPGRSGIRSLLHALAELAVAGVPVDVAELFEDRGAKPESWSRPAKAARWVVSGHLVRTGAGDVVPGGLRPADSAPQTTAPVAGANGGDPGNGNGAAAGGTHQAGGPNAAGPPPGQVLADYFRAAQQIIESGHSLLLNYLGVPPGQAPNGAGQGGHANGAGVGTSYGNGVGNQSLMPAPVGPAGMPTLDGGLASQPGGAPATPDLTPAGADVAAPPGEQAPSVADAMGTPDELLTRLTAIVAERTGYPEDVLEPDLDVEADLSIDSIKRLEILGELADQIGLGGDGALNELEHLVEQLAARKTLRGIVEFMFEHAPGLDGEPAPQDQPAAAQDVATQDAATQDAAAFDAAPALAIETEPVDNAIPQALNRFTLELVEAPMAPSSLRAPDQVVVQISGESALAGALESELTARGATVVQGEAVQDGQPSVSVVTDAFDGADAPALYRRLRPLLLGSDRDIVVATPFGGHLGIGPPPSSPSASGGGSASGGDLFPAGAGARGLVRTAALEFPQREVRLVDLDPTSQIDQLAQALADEVLCAEGRVEVGRQNGSRLVPVVAERSTSASATSTLPLTDGSVVLLTGGARGITARVALALAQQARCHLHLVGRTAWPEGDEPEDLAACRDKLDLRRALAEGGGLSPREIEPACNRILAEREMRSLAAQLDQTGASFTYHQLDVRDRSGLAALIAGLYEQHGRLDGVVHGAGALDDHLIADKEPEAFDRIYTTKVDAALTLIGAMREGHAERRGPAPAFVAFFGSIAGVSGNRGQADYAAANDALGLLAASNQDLASRVLTIHWGPWSPEAGMVSEPLGKLFQAAGMGLIEPDDGVSALLDELAVETAGSSVPGRAAHPQVAQVVAARCAPGLLALSFPSGNGAFEGRGNGGGN